MATCERCGHKVHFTPQMVWSMSQYGKVLCDSCEAAKLTIYHNPHLTGVV